MIPHSSLPQPVDWTPQMALAYMTTQYENGSVRGTKAVAIAYDDEGGRLSYSQAGMSADELIAVAERFKAAVINQPPGNEHGGE